VSRAQAAFEAWAKHTRSNWEWDYLPQNVRQAWELAADAAARWVPAEHPAPREDGRVDRRG